MEDSCDYHQYAVTGSKEIVVFQFLEVGVRLRILLPEKRMFCIVNISKKSQHDSDIGGGGRGVFPPLRFSAAGDRSSIS
jgi:hypothetical protein